MEDFKDFKNESFKNDFVNFFTAFNPNERKENRVRAMKNLGGFSKNTDEKLLRIIQKSQDITLFRGRKLDGTWTFGLPVNTNISAIHTFNDTFEYVERNTITQYIGKVDRKKHPLFVGDIYKLVYSADHIVYRRILFQGAAFCGGISEDFCSPLEWKNDIDSNGPEPIQEPFCETIEKIGNVFDNIEMLSLIKDHTS